MNCGKIVELVIVNYIFSSENERKEVPHSLIFNLSII